jgi:hypothetical protein
MLIDFRRQPNKAALGLSSLNLPCWIHTRQVVPTLMADHKLDALVYATFDHQPALIAPDVMTKPVIDDDRLGTNRLISPILGFPAMTVPAEFTTDGMPVGIEFMARPMIVRHGTKIPARHQPFKETETCPRFWSSRSARTRSSGNRVFEPTLTCSGV